MADDNAAKARAERLTRALRDNLRRRKGVADPSPEPAAPIVEPMSDPGDRR